MRYHAVVVPRGRRRTLAAGIDTRMDLASECEILVVTAQKCLELRHLFYKRLLESVILMFDV